MDITSLRSADIDRIMMRTNKLIIFSITEECRDTSRLYRPCEYIGCTRRVFCLLEFTLIGEVLSNITTLLFEFCSLFFSLTSCLREDG